MTLNSNEDQHADWFTVLQVLSSKIVWLDQVKPVISSVDRLVHDWEFFEKVHLDSSHQQMVIDQQDIRTSPHRYPTNQSHSCTMTFEESIPTKNGCFASDQNGYWHTSGAMYCGVPQNVAVVCPNGTLILHRPKSTNLIWPNRSRRIFSN